MKNANDTFTVKINILWFIKLNIYIMTYIVHIPIFILNMSKFKINTNILYYVIHATIIIIRITIIYSVYFSIDYILKLNYKI